MSIINSEQSVENQSVALVEALARFERAYSRWLETPLQHTGLSYARIRLMRVLNQKGPQIMSALSEELVVSPRNITVLVDALEDSGWVRRLPHPTDRRATIVELTPEGTEICSSMYSQHAAAASELFNVLTISDQMELLRILNLLGIEMEHRGIIGEPPRKRN